MGGGLETRFRIRQQKQSLAIAGQVAPAIGFPYNTAPVAGPLAQRASLNSEGQFPNEHG